LVWGVTPDFWSLSGSGLILGGAIWVAVAKSWIKAELGDVERDLYEAVELDETGTGNDNGEFEVGDDEIDGVRSEGQNQDTQNLVTREEE
jgi:hypothetical protein